METHDPDDQEPSRHDRVYNPRAQLTQEHTPATAAERASPPRHSDGRESYYIGKCGHRVPAESGVTGLLFYIGPCRECDEELPGD